MIQKSLQGGRKVEPTLWINLGICLIVFGSVRHFSEGPAPEKVDNAYLFYWVEIRNPKNIDALLPIYIMRKSPSTFENVDCWWLHGDHKHSIIMMIQTLRIGPLDVR